MQRVSAWMVLGLFGRCVRGCLVARHCLLWWCWIYLGVPYVVRWHMWLKGIRFSTSDPFFVFPFLFSLLLDFCTWPFKFSKHSFNLLFIWIWSLFFLLLFGLFRLIYKLSFFFNFITLQFFHLSNVVLIFLLLFVLFEIIFEICFTILASLCFFPIKFDFHSFDCYFFYFGYLLNCFIFQCHPSTLNWFRIEFLNRIWV